MGDFDPIRKRRAILGNVGAEWHLQQELPPAAQYPALHGIASDMLHEAIYCHIVGLDAYVLPLLRKADEWSWLAVGPREGPCWPQEPGFHLCMSSWILAGAPDPDACQKSILWSEQDLAETGYDPIDVRFTLQEIVFCGGYADALRVFGMSRKLTRPALLSSIRTDAPMAYAVANHLLSGEHTRDEILRTVAAFLRRSMNMWLGGGHSVRAATWLYIAHVLLGQSEEPPLDILLKCYDYLPPAIRALR
jgi:hypothetical protein